MQKTGKQRFESGGRTECRGGTKKQGSRIAKRGAAAVLERMTLDEWDALMAGETSAAELEEKYRGPDARATGDEQANLGRWSA
jgi:hypothetical protein